MDNKEAKYKPLKANVTVDMRLLFREQKAEEQKEKESSHE